MRRNSPCRRQPFLEIMLENAHRSLLAFSKFRLYYLLCKLRIEVESRNRLAWNCGYLHAYGNYATACNYKAACNGGSVHRFWSRRRRLHAFQGYENINGVLTLFFEYSSHVFASCTMYPLVVNLHLSIQIIIICHNNNKLILKNIVYIRCGITINMFSQL